MSSDKEEDLRNSVSRAYYSYYHKVKKFLGFQANSFKRHEDLINCIREDERIRKRAKLANAMQQMKQNREQADYRPEPNGNQTELVFKKESIQNFWMRYDFAIELLNNERENLY